MPTEYDAAAAFERIEHELIDSMMKNLSRHIEEEDKYGFEWEQWQVLQLQNLERLRRSNQKKYGKQFRSINRRIVHAITLARSSGREEMEIEILKMLQKHPSLAGRFRRDEARIAGKEFFGVNQRKLDALLMATTGDLEKAEHACLRRVDDQYRRIIFDAQVYANTGAGTPAKAIDMATHDFLKRGIDCIEYKNGARHTISDYAGMAVITATKRAHCMGEGEMRREWGMSLVIVNKRGGNPCPHCAKYVGKILVDDVYSGGRPDGKHTLLSEAMKEGFLHPRCRDGYSTYFPRVSDVPEGLSRKEMKEAVESEKEENRENYVRRQAESYSRLAEFSLDQENRRQYETRADKWNAEAEKYHEKANTQKDPLARAFFEERAEQMRAIPGDTRLQRIFKGTRFRDGAHVKKFIDITDNWFKDAVPKSHPVVTLQKYVKDGVEYVVDNFHVVMKPSPNEIRVANLLKDKIGGEISIVPKVNYPELVRTPDYLFNGYGYDLKTITGNGESVLRDAVKRKRGQARRFIFDVSNSRLTASDIEKQMHGMFGDIHTAFVEEVVIVRGDEIEKVYRKA